MNNSFGTSKLTVRLNIHLSVQLAVHWNVQLNIWRNVKLTFSMSFSNGFFCNGGNFKRSDGGKRKMNNSLFFETSFHFEIEFMLQRDFFFSLQER